MQELQQGQKYEITVSTSFIGEFVEYVDDNVGNRFAIFEQAGKDRHGKPPQRKVNMNNFVGSRRIE